MDKWSEQDQQLNGLKEKLELSEALKELRKEKLKLTETLLEKLEAMEVPRACTTSFLRGSR